MSHLQDVYSDKEQKNIYVSCTMKNKLVEFFGNKLIFITVRPNTPNVMISSETIESTLNMSDKESSIKRVASYLHKGIHKTVDHYHLSAGLQLLKSFALKTDTQLPQ